MNSRLAVFVKNSRLAVFVKNSRLAVFVKNEKGQMIKCVPSGDNDSIWIKIKKEESGELEEIYIVTTYLSPTQTDIND